MASIIFAIIIITMGVINTYWFIKFVKAKEYFIALMCLGALLFATICTLVIFNPTVAAYFKA